MNVGAEVAHDYFNHRFWIESGADSVYDRERIRNLAKVKEPDFSNHSLAGVADTLRSLGDLELLRIAIKNERAINKFTPPDSLNDCLAIKNGLPGDAFDVWQKHYSYYGLNTMVGRIESLRKSFDSLIREGLGGIGVRVLDHGICSGLLLLLYSTFYFKVFFGLGDTPPPDENDKAVWNRFREASKVSPPPPFAEVDYDALWWWTGVVWATAATALHNVHQFSHSEKLSLDEDPLAYLGILVDHLQEWDRYTVSRESVIAGALPLQGVDVKLGTASGKVQIYYGDSLRADKVFRELSIALSEEWKEIVDIQA